MLCLITFIFDSDPVNVFLASPSFLCYCVGSTSHGNCCTDTHDADVCKITHVKVIINNTGVHVPLVVQVSALQEVCASKAEERLVNEAKKWATKAAKDYKITSHGERVRITTESKDPPPPK